MNRTVRDMTKELGTNKNVIYRIIERQNLEPVPTANPKETKRYDDESYQIIKDEFSRLQEKHGAFLWFVSKSSAHKKLAARGIPGRPPPEPMSPTTRGEASSVRELKDFLIISYPARKRLVRTFYIIQNDLMTDRYQINGSRMTNHGVSGDTLTSVFDIKMRSLLQICIYKNVACSSIPRSEKGKGDCIKQSPF